MNVFKKKMLYRRRDKRKGKERLAQEAGKDQGFGSQGMSEHGIAEQCGTLKPESSGF